MYCKVFEPYEKYQEYPIGKTCTENIPENKNNKNITSKDAVQHVQQDMTDLIWYFQNKDHMLHVVP